MPSSAVTGNNQAASAIYYAAPPHLAPPMQEMRYVQDNAPDRVYDYAPDQ
jgi:hypothetical protein